MIKIENLSKSFGKLNVLSNVNLHVEKGECIAIIGPSGTGKSVFLRSIDLLEKPDSGRIWICGDEITAKGANVDIIRRKMGMVYQSFNLFSHMDVLENIILAPMKLRGMSREAAVAKARELLAMVSLESKIHAMPTELSGGQKQRIAIARCLAMEPEIMLFDEPTSALDPTMVGEVLATIRALTKHGMTMLIVTHEMAFAREVSDRVLYMDECGIYESGSSRDIFDNPRREKTRAFIHKLKSLNMKIDCREYDLLNLQSRIIGFCEKYNIDARRTNMLQLSVEELIGSLISGCESAGMSVDVEINIAYGEADKSLKITLTSVGADCDPFADIGSIVGAENAGDKLGFIMLAKMAKDIQHDYNGVKNTLVVII